MEIQWHLKKFNQLDPKTLWQIYSLRERVFVIEQASLYPDIDKQDLHSYHLYATDQDGKLVAYSRFYKINNDPSFGRVVVPKSLRKIGLGRELVKQILIEIQKIYGHCQITIDAQTHAKGFYRKLGFKVVSKPFMDAMRMHVKMIRSV